MSAAFTRFSTMPQVAALAGENPTNHPRTACAAATEMVLSAETFMNKDQEKRLHAAVPILKDSRKPKALRQRLEFLTERALRKYAVEALLAAGSKAAAAALRDEPSTTRAATLAKQFGDTLYKTVPADIKRAQDSRKLTAARACRYAEKAVRCLENEDPTTQLNAAQKTAWTLLEWAQSTKQDPGAETVAILENMVKIQ